MPMMPEASVNIAPDNLIASANSVKPTFQSYAQILGGAITLLHVCMPALTFRLAEGVCAGDVLILGRFVTGTDFGEWLSASGVPAVKIE